MPNGSVVGVDTAMGGAIGASAHGACTGGDDGASDTTAPVGDATTGVNTSAFGGVDDVHVAVDVYGVAISGADVPGVRLNADVAVFAVADDVPASSVELSSLDLSLPEFGHMGTAMQSGELVADIGRSAQVQAVAVATGADPGTCLVVDVVGVANSAAFAEEVVSAGSAAVHVIGLPFPNFVHAGAALLTSASVAYVVHVSLLALSLFSGSSVFSYTL